MKSFNHESGISGAIQKTMSCFLKNDQLIEEHKKKEFSIKIANSLPERESVFNLGYKVYLEKGFIKPNPQNWMIQDYDFDLETVVLIVQDNHKNLVGSITLVFDGSSKLPAEKTYNKELKNLRNSGDKFVEISRLVIDPQYRNSKEILVLLFNYLSIYSYHIKKYSSLVIEVNPRHKAYYKTLLSFDEIGEERACKIVQNAPAVLLHLPLERYQSEVKRCKHQKIENKKERSLYSFFLNLEQESLVSFCLAKQAIPMSAEEKLYFGFSDTNLEMVAAI